MNGCATTAAMISGVQARQRFPQSCIHSLRIAQTEYGGERPGLCCGDAWNNWHRESDYQLLSWVAKGANSNRTFLFSVNKMDRWLPELQNFQHRLQGNSSIIGWAVFWLTEKHFSCCTSVAMLFREFYVRQLRWTINVLARSLGK